MLSCFDLKHVLASKLKTTTSLIEPEALYEAGDGSFEFERTASRLNEMQSDEYMALGHGAQA